MDTGMYAINEDEMNILISNLSDYIDNVSKSFSEMDTLVQESNVFFNGDVADKFRKKYGHFSDEYKTIINNLESYKTDLINVRNNFIGFDKTRKATEVNEIKLEEGGNLSGVNEI